MICDNKISVGGKTLKTKYKVIRKLSLVDIEKILSLTLENLLVHNTT